MQDFCLYLHIVVFPLLHYLIKYFFYSAGDNQPSGVHTEQRHELHQCDCGVVGVRPDGHADLLGGI